MSETRSDRLATLRRNLDRLTQEAEALADTMEHDSRLVREETVGAELLAGREALAHLGIVWDTADQLGAVYARQARYFVDDHAATFRGLLEGGGRQPLDMLGEHLGRRFEHLGEGLNQSLEVVSKQTERACTALGNLWTPFARVVRQDWAANRADRQNGGKARHDQSPIRRQLSAPVR